MFTIPLFPAVRLALILIIFLISPCSFGQGKVVHLVLFKLKPGIEKSETRFQAILSEMEKIPSKIPAIKEWKFGENFSERAIAYDLGLYCTFSSRQELQIYLTHPAHVNLGKQLAEIADWHIADFEIP